MTTNTRDRAIPEPTVQIREYAVSCLPPDNPNARYYTLLVQWRGGDLWAITDGFCFLGADGTWSMGYVWRDGTQEPLTDKDFTEVRNGDAAWKAAHRFDRDTALALARRHAPLMTCNGYSVGDALRRTK